MIVRPAIVILLALAMAPAAVAAAPSDETWLVSAVSAPRRVSYVGTKEIVLWSDRGTQASMVDVAHRAPAALRLEYRPTVRRHRRIVIDDGRQRWYYEPTTRLVLISTSSAEGDDAVSAGRLRLLLNNYAATVVGRDSVAGRPAVVVTVRPRIGRRPWLRLWLDEATALILRSEHYHADGRLSEMATFTRIDFREPEPGLFRFTPPAGVTVRQVRPTAAATLADLPGRVGFVPVAPQRLPEGFILDRVRLGGTAALPVAVLQYTDGLAALTLFQRRADPGARHTLPSGRLVSVGAGEATLANLGSASVLHWQNGEVVLTLLGELLSEDLTAIATGIGVEPPPGRLARLGSWMTLLWHRLAAIFAR